MNEAFRYAHRHTHTNTSLFGFICIYLFLFFSFLFAYLDQIHSIKINLRLLAMQMGYIVGLSADVVVVVVFSLISAVEQTLPPLLLSLLPPFCCHTRHLTYAHTRARSHTLFESIVEFQLDSVAQNVHTNCVHKQSIVFVKCRCKF